MIFRENDEVGDHYTPRDVIKLMVTLVLCEDGEELIQKGHVTTVFGLACGTGNAFLTPLSLEPYETGTIIAKHYWEAVWAISYAVRQNSWRA